MVDTNAHARVVSIREGGRNWSSVEVSVTGAMVTLISWAPVSEGDTRIRRDEGGWGGQADDESS